MHPPTDEARRITASPVFAKRVTAVSCGARLRVVGTLSGRITFVDVAVPSIAPLSPPGHDGVGRAGSGPEALRPVADAGPIWAVHAHDRLGSTSDEARRLAQDGAPDGTTVWARVQTAGRGRRGRAWASPDGNLHMSVVLHCGEGLAPQLGFVAALAVADAVDTVCGSARARLKWPNDVLLEGAKLAGLLLEVEYGAVVLGIGVNLQHVPSEVRQSATSLHACGVDVATEVMLDLVLRSLQVRLQAWRDAGFTATLAAWSERGHHRGDPLRVSVGQRQVEASFVGLDRDGSLLARVDGVVERFTSAEVLSA